MIKRIILIVDIDPIRADGTDASVSAVLIRDPHDFWLDVLAEGAKIGIGDALGLAHPVKVIESIVTDPDFEQVRIAAPRLSPGRGIKISG